MCFNPFMDFPLQLQSFHFQGQDVALFVPAPEAIQKAYEQGGMDFPYWAQVWPAAQALAGFLVRYPDLIKNKKVVELGAGLGLPSLVAARYASFVLCSDYLPEAVTVMLRSAVHNRLNNFSAQVLNWESMPADLEADVLLLSDINYEPGKFRLLQELIQQFLKKGTVVLLSTPQRLMARSFLTPLLFYCRQQEEIPIIHNGKEVVTSVLVLRKDSLVGSR